MLVHGVDHEYAWLALLCGACRLGHPGEHVIIEAGHGLVQVLGRWRLEQIVERLLAYGVYHILVVAGVEYHLGVGVYLLVEQLAELYARHGGHLDIGEDEVGSQLYDFFYGCVGIGAGAYHLDRILAFQHAAQHFDGVAVVVDDVYGGELFASEHSVWLL